MSNEQMYQGGGDMYQGGVPAYPTMFGIQPTGFPSPSPVATLPLPSKIQSKSPPMSPQQQQQDGGMDKFKTELCRKFAMTGFCRYGDMCQFAHGPQELRALVRHPLYKTSPCKSFEASGTCRYGARCRFIHGENQEQLATVARGVPALNLQITEPSWEEAQAAAIDAVQHLAAVTGLSPQLVATTLGGSPSVGPQQRIPMPDPVSLETPKPPLKPMTTSPLNPAVEATLQSSMTSKGERTLSMSQRSKTEPSELGRALSSPQAHSGSTGEIRSISSIIMINGANGASSNGQQGRPSTSPTHRAPGTTLNGQPKRNTSSVKLVVDEDVFPPANLDARRLPVANSGSWVNLPDMAASSSSNKQGPGAPVSPTRFSRQSESLKHSYSQPLLGGDTWLSFSSDTHLGKPTGSIASLPVLPPTSPMSNTVGNPIGRTSSMHNGFTNSTSSPNLVKAFSASEGPSTSASTTQNNFRKAASYANHIWFESTENPLEETPGGWTRAKSVEGRLNIFRNLSDQDLAKTAQNAAATHPPRLPSFEEKLGEVGLALSDDEDRATDEERGHDTEEDEGFTVGKF